MAEASIRLRSQEEARALFGPQDEYLRKVRAATQASIVLRGNEIRVFGSRSQVGHCCQILAEWQDVIARRGELLKTDVIRSLDPDIDPESPAVVSDRRGESQSADDNVNSEEFVRVDAPSRSSGPPTSDDPSTDRPSWQGRGEGASVASRNGYDRAAKVRPKTTGQGLYMSAMQDHPLVFCDGPAGSGKTYLAVAQALQALRSEEVRKIVLVRPAVEAGEKLGFLPGDLLAKVNPFLRPLLDAINDLLDYDQVRRYMANDVIEVVPLAFMRGRTLNDTFMILDEGQNTTITQMKMFLTRMGVNSRIVVTGDATQNDLPAGTRSGLRDGISRLSGIEGVAIVRLTGKDIVRHRLVREIVSAYDEQSDAVGNPPPRPVRR